MKISRRETVVPVQFRSVVPKISIRGGTLRRINAEILEELIALTLMAEAQPNKVFEIRFTIRNSEYSGSKLLISTAAKKSVKNKEKEKK